MNLSEEQLSQTEEMAGLFFSLSDIADSIEADLEEIEIQMEIKQGDFYCAYRRGWLISDIKLRKDIRQAAENGSNPAQVMMLNFQKGSLK